VFAALTEATQVLLIAPIGASAVLAFAVPASPLAQPWPIIGGNCLSALAGTAIGWAVPFAPLAAALAVPIAILVMSLARCLHPPGGAVALLAATASGVLMPAVLDSALLVAAALLFHRFSGHSYPHRTDQAQATRELAAEGLQPSDLSRALEDLGETFDIAPEDLSLLVARAEHHAAERRNMPPTTTRILC
jgi:CBS domain-containing membrane protein